VLDYPPKNVTSIVENLSQYPLDKFKEIWRKNKNELKNWKQSGKSNTGATLIHQASKNGDIDLIKFLIKKGFDIHSKDAAGRSCIHYAAEYGNIHVIKELRKLGLSSSMPDNNGATPLMIASKHGSMEVVRHYIKNYNENILATDNKGRNILHYASESSNHFVAREILTSYGKLLNSSDYNNVTPLHLACEHSNLGMVKYLIKMGVKTFVEDSNGRTPLFYATTRFEDGNKYYDKPYHEIIELLLNKKEINHKDNFGNSILNYATLKNESYTVQYFAEKGFDVNNKGDNVPSPLFHFSARGNLDLCKVLLKNGANSHELDTDGNTVLHNVIAASKNLNKHSYEEGNFIDTIKLLLEHNTETNKKNNLGLTPTHLAAIYNQSEICSELAGKGADINQLDDIFGLSPLHMSVILGNIESTTRLLANGADVNKKSKEGFTPFQYAKFFANSSDVYRLLRYGAYFNKEEPPIKTQLSLLGDSKIKGIEGSKKIQKMKFFIDEINFSPSKKMRIDTQNAINSELKLNKEVFDAIDYLCKHKRDDIPEDTKFLLSSIDVDSRDMRGKNPSLKTMLQIAIEHRAFKLIKIISSWEPSINVKDVNGKTSTNLIKNSGFITRKRFKNALVKMY
jgi:ankyrin repeat protein